MASAGKCAVALALCFRIAAGLVLKSSDPPLELMRSRASELFGEYVGLAPMFGMEEVSSIRDSHQGIAWSWFKNKKVLFLGDSTMEEIAWEFLYSLNETEEAVVPIPSEQCYTGWCASLCNDAGFKEGDELWQHYIVRCADGERARCQDTLPVLKEKYNLSFQFFWTGNQYVCANGYGLTGAVSDAKWLDAFRLAVKSKGPYDLVLFTAGNHDYVSPDADTESNFKTALNRALSEDLFKLGTQNIFLLSATSEGRGAAMDVLKKPENSGWTVIDRLPYHSSMHCAMKHVNSTYVDYSRQPACHTLVEAIVDTTSQSVAS